MAIRLKDADSSLGRLVSVLAGAGADLAGLHSQTQAYVGVLDSRFQNLAAALAGVHAESSSYTGTMWGDLLGLTSSLYGNLGNIGAGYTLANATAGLPFTVSTPIPPTITSEATVTPATLAANLVNGRRVTLQAGSYGNQAFNTQDQEFIFLAGADVGFVTIGAAARRLIFRGSPARAGVMRYIDTPPGGGPTDILFNGVTLDHADRQWNRSNLLQMQRLAIINSYIRALDQPLATFPNAEGGRLADAIFGNNHFHSIGTNASAVRFQIPLRLVFVDNRVQNTVSGQQYHTFRIHGNPGTPYLAADNCYVVRNQFEGPGHQIQRPQGLGLHSEVINVWYENNANYGTLYQPINIGAGTNDYVTNFRIRNNALYQGGQSWPSAVLPAWTVSGNTTQAYQSPPVWEYQ